MPHSTRSATTIYLDPKVAKAAKVKAAVMGKSLSDLANEGLLRLLREDEEILRVVRSRRREKPRDYEEFLMELRADGLL
jgi:hypothetical protein